MDYILIRFEPSPRFKEDYRVMDWVNWFKKNNIVYEFGYIDGREVGVYLHPNDALLFKLMFGEV